MLVFVSGMPRSGSTFSHNVVRLALEARSKSVVSVTAGEDSSPILARRRKAEHIIAKSHGADERLLALVHSGEAKSICTVRRPEDAILSWMHVFGFSLDEALDAFSKWFAMFERIASHSLVITLDEIERVLVQAALRIGRYVCPDYTISEAEQATHALSKQQVQKISEAVERGERRSTNIGFSQYDNKTFFHRRHISDRSQFNRSPEITDAVNKRFAGWIDEAGEVHRRYLRQYL